jgi:hypothetical protein
LRSPFCAVCRPIEKRKRHAAKARAKYHAQLKHDAEWWATHCARGRDYYQAKRPAKYRETPYSIETRLAAMDAERRKSRWSA